MEAAHVYFVLTRKEKDRTECLEAERALVALPDFKSGAPGEELGGWVRFPCASAKYLMITVNQL